MNYMFITYLLHIYLLHIYYIKQTFLRRQQHVGNMFPIIDFFQ